VVTAADVEVLRQLGLINQGLNLEPVIGSMLFAGVLVSILAGYLWFLRPRLAKSAEMAIITSVIIAVGILAGDTLASVSAVSYFVVPTTVMLVTALVDNGLGLVLAGVMSLAIAVCLAPT